MKSQEDVICNKYGTYVEKQLWIRQISDRRFSAKEPYALLIKEGYSSETSVTVYQPT
jgi:hypothetical protein